MTKKASALLLIALALILGAILWCMTPKLGDVVSTTEKRDEVQNYKDVVLYDNVSINHRDTGIWGLRGLYIPDNFSGVVCVDENGDSNLKNLELYDWEIIYNSEEEKIEQWTKTTTYQWLFFTMKEKKTWYKVYLSESEK